MVPGKSHYMADALSRAPLFAGPNKDDDELAINTVKICLTQVVEENRIKNDFRRPRRGLFPVLS